MIFDFLFLKKLLCRPSPLLLLSLYTILLNYVPFTSFILVLVNSPRSFLQRYDIPLLLYHAYSQTLYHYARSYPVVADPVLRDV